MRNMRRIIVLLSFIYIALLSNSACSANAPVNLAAAAATATIAATGTGREGDGGVPVVVTVLAIGDWERDNGYASGVLALGASLDANANVPGLLRVCVVDTAAHIKYGAFLEKVGWQLLVVDSIGCKQNGPTATRSQETLTRFGPTCTKLHILKLLTKDSNARELIGVDRIRALLYLDSDAICVSSLRQLFEEWGDISSAHSGVGMALDGSNTGDYQSNCIMFGRRFIDSAPASKEMHESLVELASTTVSDDGGDQGLINTYLAQHKEDVPVSELPSLMCKSPGEGGDPVAEFSGHKVFKPWHQNTLDSSTWKNSPVGTYINPQLYRLFIEWSRFCRSAFDKLGPSMRESAAAALTTTVLQLLPNETPLLCGNTFVPSRFESGNGEL